MAMLEIDTRFPPISPPKAYAISRAASSLLALDLGSRTGWALRGASGIITSGTNLYRPGRFEGAGMAFVRFDGWLSDIARASGPLASVVFVNLILS